MLPCFPSNRAVLPLLAAIVMGACSAPPALAPIEATRLAPQVTLYPTQAATMQADAPTIAASGAQYAGEWKPASSGIDYILTQVTVNEREELVLMARVDPSKTNIHVHYDPSQPKTAREWQGETQAGLIINGGFFNDKNQVTGLIIAEGDSSGKSYRGFGGDVFGGAGRRAGGAMAAR